MCKQGMAYAIPYSILIPIISLQYIDMRIPYFPTCLAGMLGRYPNFIQLRTGHE